MKNTLSIGLKESDSKKTVEKLNALLANYSVFYQNTKGSYWNIKGDQFFTLHPKFEELYNNLILKIDAIAERILTLGSTPPHNYSYYLQMSTIKETNKTTNDFKNIQDIIDSLNTLISLQRNLLKFSEDIGDTVTSSLIRDFITEQEKDVWMYAAYVRK